MRTLWNYGTFIATLFGEKIKEEGKQQLLFNIQKCSIHDGNGLRTLVFFKGCPLRCKWCANPESQDFDREIMESPGKCIGCGTCISVCSSDAIVPTENGLKIIRDKCTKCFKCAESCYSGAKYVIGKEYSTEELYKEIEKDKVFYSIQGGGGVTFSGGEPLAHAGELTKIAKLCRKRGIDVAIESCGMGNYEEFKEALPYINNIFLDIKHMDTNVHKKFTGAGNELILSNIKKIASHGINITVRTPVIPGINDSEKNITDTARFIKDIPQITAYELLPYHKFGVNKYTALGRPYELNDIEPPEDNEMRALVKAANAVFNNTDKICFYTKDNEKIIVK